MKQLNYNLTNEKWGDPISVTIDDVREQAKIYSIDPESILSDNDEIYYYDNDEKIVIAERG